MNSVRYASICKEASRHLVDGRSHPSLTKEGSSPAPAVSRLKGADGVVNLAKRFSQTDHPVCASFSRRGKGKNEYRGSVARLQFRRDAQSGIGNQRRASRHRDILPAANGKRDGIPADRRPEIHFPEHLARLIVIRSESAVR